MLELHVYYFATITGYATRSWNDFSEASYGVTLFDFLMSGWYRTVVRDHKSQAKLTPMGASAARA